MITKKERNSLLEAIAKTDLNVGDFDLIGSADSKLRIIQISTGSYFEVGQIYKGYIIDRQVAGYPAEKLYPDKWADVWRMMNGWVANIIDDLNTPDLWDELRHQREFLSEAGYGASPNRPFTADERSEIAAQIRQIKEFLRENASLTSEQLSDIEKRLDEAEGAASRINQKDWLLLFLGIMFTLIISGLLTPETVQHILGMAIHGLSHLYAAGEKPPELLSS